MAAPVPVACVGVVWAGNGWGGKRLKAAGLTGGAVSTLGGGQQPVKCAIPDQWSQIMPLSGGKDPPPYRDQCWDGAALR